MTRQPCRELVKGVVASVGLAIVHDLRVEHRCTTGSSSIRSTCSSNMVRYIAPRPVLHDGRSSRSSVAECSADDVHVAGDVLRRHGADEPRVALEAPRGCAWCRAPRLCDESVELAVARDHPRAWSRHCYVGTLARRASRRMPRGGVCMIQYRPTGCSVCSLGGMASRIVVPLHQTLYLTSSLGGQRRPQSVDNGVGMFGVELAGAQVGREVAAEAQGHHYLQIDVRSDLAAVSQPL